MFLNLSYQLDTISFINYIELKDEQLHQILNWRNHPDIRKWMYNAEPISMKDHIEFCSKLSQSTNKGYWLVQIDNQNIGTVNINPFDSTKNEAEWGFFLNPEFFKSDYSLTLFFYTVKLFLEEFNLNALSGFVKKTNASAIALNEFFGMLEYTPISPSSVPFPNEYSARKLSQTEWEKMKISPINLKNQFVAFIKDQRNRKLDENKSYRN